MLGRALRIAALMLVCLVLTTATAQDVLRVAIPNDVISLDPHDSRGRGDSVVGMNMFDALITRDETMAFQPGLAERWDISEDGRTYTFFLRQGVRYHNGSEVVADDVKFSLERVLEMPESVSRGSFEGVVASVEVEGPYTVRIDLHEPDPTFLSKISASSGHLKIASRAYFDEVGADQFARNPIGSGPYQFVSWTRDERLVMRAFDDYHLGMPTFEEIHFIPIPSEATRAAALVSGELDIVGPLSPEHVEMIERAPAARVEAAPSVRRVYVAFRSDEAPFDDPRVRQAINYAVDVDTLIDRLLGGQANRMNQPAISFEFGYSDRAYTYTYDPERARALLEEAGYGDGFSTVLDSPTGRYLKDVEVAQAVAGYLAAVGIEVDVRTHEWATFVSMFRQRTFTGMYLGGYGGAGMLDAHITLAAIVRSQPHGPWTGYYINEEVDALIEQGGTTGQLEERQRVYDAIVPIITEDPVWLYLWNQYDVFGVNNRVSWTPRADELLWMFDAAHAAE